jgi:hypothetical protein
MRPAPPVCRFDFLRESKMPETKTIGDLARTVHRGLAKRFGPAKIVSVDSGENDSQRERVHLSIIVVEDDKDKKIGKSTRLSGLVDSRAEVGSHAFGLAERFLKRHPIDCDGEGEPMRLQLRRVSTSFCLSQSR